MALQLFPENGSSDAQVQVDAGEDSDDFPRLSTHVEIHTGDNSVTLAFVDRFGVERSLTQLTRGVRPIAVQKILAATTAKVTVYF